MNKYITEQPIQLDFILKPTCSSLFNSEPEDESISLYVDYVEANANSLKFGNKDESYILSRDMKLYYDFDLDTPIGVEVYSEESNFTQFDIFDGYVSNHSFDELFNYLVETMIPTDKSINKHRNRLSTYKNTKVKANSVIIGAEIIGSSIHNAALIKNGTGKVL